MHGTPQCRGRPDAAQMLPLDDYDFEPRSWVPHSGWPVELAEMGMFYDRAYAAAGLNPRGRDADDDLEARAGWPGPGRRARLAPAISNYSIGRRFRSDVLGRLKAAPNARIVIHATVTGLETVGGGQEVSQGGDRRRAVPGGVCDSGSIRGACSGWSGERPSASRLHEGGSPRSRK